MTKGNKICVAFCEPEKQKNVLTGVHWGQKNTTLYCEFFSLKCTILLLKTTLFCVIGIIQCVRVVYG